MLAEIISFLGLGKPLGRGLILSSITAASLYIFEPSFAFATLQDPEDEENIMTVSKPFSLFASDYEKPYSTYVPWYIYPILAFIIFAVFI